MNAVEYRTRPIRLIGLTVSNPHADSDDTPTSDSEGIQLRLDFGPDFPY